MAGTKRIALGGLLLLVGLVLVFAGAVASNLPVTALGSLLSLSGTGLILWGAFAGLASWWRTWRSKAYQPTGAAPPPASLPYSFRSPPSPQHFLPAATHEVPDSVALMKSPGSNLSGTQVNPGLYAVDYIERGSKRRAPSRP